jgi:hypothetical protein
MMPLADALAGFDRSGIGTAPIIYLVEANSRYDAIVTPVSEQIQDGKIIGFTSVISLKEVLTQPL